ncbi:hypothetical protein SASPL_139371 [Salvia splendens]|uniref:Uncharacterized protein n=1 Tax=Salvia splendens TaxID=180675 RepID=A0A8X8WQ55_SALSN|nr:hypothetical protein SASPL_139371 [Salvia splendens]
MALLSHGSFSGAAIFRHAATPRSPIRAVQSAENEKKVADTKDEQKPPSPRSQFTPVMKKGQIVRVDKEKYLNSVNYLSVGHPPFYKGSDYIYEDRGEAIHKKGGRKFIFLNLGELGCLPGLRILNPETDGGCLEEVSELSKLHNKKLETLLVKMDQQLYGFKYFLYDFKTSLVEKTTQPLKYGFEEGRMACCGTGRLNAVFSCGGKRPVKEFQVCENPSKYVFWDSYHLTERVYKQMADEMWNAISLKELFLCF